MKELFEQQLNLNFLVVKEIRKSNQEELKKVSDFYNQAGQLSWQLNPNRIKQKMGSKGKIWALYNPDNEIVGTIGVKVLEEDEYDIGEIGYVMIKEGYRSIRNLLMLYDIAFKYAKRFDAMIITTRVSNKRINTLLNQSKRVERLFKIRSPYSTNLLYVWIVKRGRLEMNERKEIVRDYFAGHIIKEM